MNRIQPHVTFVIPTLNESQNLPRLLTSIRSQRYPPSHIKIIVADGGSTDNTVRIAKKFGAKVIHNPEILHEPGKSRASRTAYGDIIFYTDADNELATHDWLTLMVRPYQDNPHIKGLLPQTIPPPDSTGLNRYLGYLFTDPFTWFVYGSAANPKYYGNRYRPVNKSDGYVLYRFPANDIPLFGLSQGVGTHRSFVRSGTSYADDLQAGGNLIRTGSIIAYVPGASVYHYHISGLGNFIRKYTWRIRNNLGRHVKGMGLVNRTAYFSTCRKIRMCLFIPYALTLIFPAIDAIRLTLREHDPVMLWHVPTTVILGFLIVKEWILYLSGFRFQLYDYE